VASTSRPSRLRSRPRSRRFAPTSSRTVAARRPFRRHAASWSTWLRPPRGSGGWRWVIQRRPPSGRWGPRSPRWGAPPGEASLPILDLLCDLLHAGARSLSSAGMGGLAPGR